MSPAKPSPHAAVYRQWGWKTPKHAEDFPFDDQPPIDDWARLERFFAGRAIEVERARDKLFDGNNIMVRGQFGIGKSAFILAVFQRLYDYAAEINIEPIYIPDFGGVTCQDLYRHILLKLSERLAKKDKRAREIHRRLMGERISTTRSRRGKAGVDLVAVKGESEISTSETRALELDECKDRLDTLLDAAKRNDTRVFIALDDLDKPENQAAVSQMLNDAKALLRNSPGKFILTGRPLVAGFEDYTAQVLELYDETFRLEPLDLPTLKQAARGQLNLIRKSARDDFLPFAEETFERIVPLSSGIPRHFNKICRHALETARAQHWNVITPELFERECLREIEKQWSINVPMDIRRLLYFVLERSGVSLADEDVVDGLLQTMKGVTFDGKRMTSELLSDAVPFLNELVRRNLLISDEYEGILRYTVAPLARRAAETGKS